jgi:hypothetical protein
MTIDENVEERMRAFIENPSDETLARVISLSKFYHYRCLLGCLVFGVLSACPKECPSLIVSDGGYNCGASGLSYLEELWRIDQAKTVLYVMQLLACAESYVETHKFSKKEAR